MSKRKTPCIVTSEEAQRQEEIIKQLRMKNDLENQKLVSKSIIILLLLVAK